MSTIGLPKDSLFGNNGLFKKLTQEYQQKRIREATKEKEIFEQINRVNEHNIEAYIEKMTNQNMKNRYTLKGTFDQAGNYYAFNQDVGHSSQRHQSKAVSLKNSFVGWPTHLAQRKDSNSMLSDDTYTKANTIIARSTNYSQNPKFVTKSL